LRLRGLKVLLTYKKSIWRKKYLFDKKIKNAFNGSKSLKITKTHFWQKFKNKAFAEIIS
jgi:hypothetical protein